MAAKKFKCLTLREKSKILDEISQGVGVTSIALKYGIAKSTVCSIKNKKHEIKKTVSNTFLGPGKRKTLKKQEFPRMEQALYRWFIKQRENHAPVSGEMIKAKATELHRKISGVPSGFNASQGWLQRFKKRFGVRFLKVSGEKLSAHPELVGPFQEKLQLIMREKQISEDSLYNADESSLFWKLLPDKTFVASCEKTASGRKNDKQRITFLACTNATGTHKVKPLVIGRAKTPRSFKNFVCPVNYKSSKNAWMTATIFKEWFHEMFVPEVRSFSRQCGHSGKAILILDNAPCHPPEDELKTADGKIITLFMPPNVTPLIQPMDQNVIRITKLNYRKILLTSIMAKSSDIASELKSLTIKDAVQNFIEAWSRISADVIVKCWKPLLSFVADRTGEDEDDIPLSVLQNRWRNCDIDTRIISENIRQIVEILGPTITEADVGEWNEEDNNIGPDFSDELIDADSETEDQFNEKEKITSVEAVQIFSRAIQWAEERMIPWDDILTLRKLKERAVIENLKRKKVQTEITKYFQKSA